VREKPGVFLGAVNPWIEAAGWKYINPKDVTEKLLNTVQILRMRNKLLFFY
jgi:hypothetical protein